MNLEKLKESILEFQQKVRLYRTLLSTSRDRILPEIRNNHEAIARMRSELNMDYGMLELYLKKFGNNPQMRDGVHPEYYFAYPNAFSSDVLVRVGPSVDAVLQDLDYLLGRLNAIKEDEFSEVLRLSKREKSQSPSNKNYWQLTNPVWLLWLFTKWIWQHKLISTIFTILGLLAIDYSLAWRNAVWTKNFILGLFH
ncbi:MAG: hypothetical protein Q7S57_05350 [bacterium]|nr:hypothetical protein [bacterium]